MLPAPWDVKERQVGRVTVLEVSGRMIYDRSDALDEHLQRLINAGRPNILVECSGVSAIDSHAMGVLARGTSRAMKAGGALKLLKPSPRVREGLTLVGLLRVLEAFDDESKALASFK